MIRLVVSIIILFCLLIFFTSCSDAYEKYQEVILERFSDGELKKETFVVDSSAGSFFTVEYYKSGIVKDCTYFKNSIATGRRYYCNLDDSVVIEASMTNGKLEGKTKWYYASHGEIFCKGQYKNNNKEGNWVYYYPNGTIKINRFYYTSGKPLYERIYDEKGKIKLIIGDPVLSLDFVPDTFPDVNLVGLLNFAELEGVSFAFSTGEYDMHSKSFRTPPIPCDQKFKGDSIFLYKENGVAYKAVVLKDGVNYFAIDFSGKGNKQIGIKWISLDATSKTNDSGIVCCYPIYISNQISQ